MTDEEKPLRTLMRHIRNVQDNCELLAERLIEQGKHELARALLANSMLHDNSKFRGIEWEFLNENGNEQKSRALELAIKQHRATNRHHPEYWGGIQDMPDVYVAELVCDWKARSDEFGTDLREWVKDKATKMWEFNTQSKVYRKIKKYMDLLLDPAFKGP
jgi:hypothetical protein